MNLIKTNIIEFITNLSDGGAENLVKDYSILIDKERFNVSIVTIRNYTDTAVYKTLIKNGIDIIPVYPKWNLFIRIYNKFLGYWHINRRLKTIFKERNAEVIHAHLYTLKYIFRIRKQLKNVRLFYTCHNIPKVYFDKRTCYYAKSLHKLNGMRIIVLHDDMRVEINKILGIDNTVVVRNGIDFNRFYVTKSKNEIRESIGIPAESFVIGHVGRFVEQKNHCMLVEIFQKICKKRSDAFLLMVGSGELSGEIENALDNVGLTGKYLILSHRSDIPELMKAMDVFVFPSKYEGLGIVLVEAQVSGLKCVVSEAVPHEAFLTDKIISLGFEEPIEKWCDTIFDDQIKGAPYGRLEDYDMNLEIKKLENLYLNKI